MKDDGIDAIEGRSENLSTEGKASAVPPYPYPQHSTLDTNWLDLTIEVTTS